MKHLKLIFLASVVAFAACGGKKEEKKDQPPPPSNPTPKDPPPKDPPPPPPPAGSGSGSGSSASTVPAAGSGSNAATPTESEDSIIVLGGHKDKEKAKNDPVKVKFTKFTVTKASFDPAKIEGGSATIELDPTGIETGSKQRDGHLQSPDFLNAAKFPKIVIDISNVKKKADKTYTADAKISAVGADKKLAVTFDVVDAKDDWIKIKGEHKFKRSEFKIGKPEADKDQTVIDDLTIQLALTLKKK